MYTHTLTASTHILPLSNSLNTVGSAEDATNITVSSAFPAAKLEPRSIEGAEEWEWDECEGALEFEISPGNNQKLMM